MAEGKEYVRYKEEKDMYIRSFTKNVDEAISIVRKNIGEMMISNLLTGLIKVGLIIVGGILIAIMATAIVISSRSMGDSPLTSSIFPVLGIVIAVMLWWTAACLADGGIIQLTNTFYQGNKMGGTTAVGYSAKKALQYFGFVGLQLLFLIPFIIAGIIIVYAFANGLKGVTDFQYWTSESVGMMLVIFIILILSIGTVIFISAVYQTLFMFGIAAIVIDGLGPVKAFKKSLSLVRGEFMQMVKKVILYYCGISAITLNLTLLIGTIVGIMAIIMKMTGSDIDMVVLQSSASLLEWPMRIGSALVVGAFAPAIITMLYHSQKCKREGEDIRLKLWKLRQTQMNKESL